MSVPPSATIQDIKQHVIDNIEGQFFTCFHLEFDGEELSEVLELGAINNFSTKSVLKMVEDPYTDREVRVHITRFREILTNFKSTNPNVGIDVGISFLSAVSRDFNIHNVSVVDDETKETNAKKQADALTKGSPFDEYDFAAAVNMGSIIPEGAVQAALETCVRSITVSSWNPPPPHRRNLGDLLYLLITTVESVTLHVTACASGFYVNRSTDRVFDPTPRSPKPCHGHTLPSLLSQASLGFAGRFATVQQQIQSRHPYEYLLSPVNHHPWLVNTPTHEADLGRALDSCLIATEASDLISTRDWNDDIQGARELPRHQPQDRVARDVQLHRAHADFVDCATRAAVGITCGGAQSLNPSDPEGSRMYIHSGIFFSHGNDQRENYERFGGAAAAHVAVGKDVDGVGLLASMDLEGIFTLGTAVIDYKGHRLVAQSIIPGILKKQTQPLPTPDPLLEGAELEEYLEGQQTVVQYGSIDNGKSVFSHEKFHELAGRVAKALHLSEHVVVDGKGEKHSMFTSVDTKGITGNDGRQYFLDLTRVTPVDIEFLETVDAESDDLPAYPHRMALLRVELVEQFFEHKLRAHVGELQEKRREAKRLAMEAAAENAEEGGDGAKEGETAEAEADDEPLEINFDFRFNPDAFVLQLAADDVGGEDPESATKAEDEEKVRQMSQFLSRTVIPVACAELLKHPGNCPLDGDKMTRYFHARGINMRYLGKLTTMMESLYTEPRAAFAKELCTQEMIARACKAILRSLLYDTPIFMAPYCVSHFLNCLLADPQRFTSTNPPSRPAHLSRVLPASKVLPHESLTPASLQARIREEIRMRFRYTLKGDGRVVEGARILPLLRSICMKVGIQLTARDHDWEGGFLCFHPGDVLNLYPIVKHSEPKSSFAEEIQEHGIYSLRQGQTQVGVELLGEVASVSEQVYSPIHPESARAYRNLATMRHETNDIEACKVMQRKAVIVSERTTGTDDPETYQQYMNLGYYECISGNVIPGFRYMIHAVKGLQMLCGGLVHPELAAADTQCAVMIYQTKRDLPIAVKFHLRALEANELIFGKESEQAIRSRELLVQTYVTMLDFRSALDEQRLVYKAVKARAGDEETDAVKEAAMTMAALTQRAVYDAKRDTDKKSIPAPTTNGTAPVNGAKTNGVHGKAPAPEGTGKGRPGSKRSGANGAAKGQSPTAIVEGWTPVAKKTVVEQIAGSIQGNKGHLSIEELMKFIEEGGSGKKKRGARN
ncbi:Intracellular distribution of mitochondria [Irineochytrium annulatum]|nr:Intracellular distribution of mitochondria [Irineochytrium annulatum]